jgi:hypothetical protein
MSVRHQAGIREKRKVGARLDDTGGAFVERQLEVLSNGAGIS